VVLGYRYLEETRSRRKMTQCMQNGNSRERKSSYELSRSLWGGGLRDQMPSRLLARLSQDIPSPRSPPCPCCAKLSSNPTANHPSASTATLLSIILAARATPLLHSQAPSFQQRGHSAHCIPLPPLRPLHLHLRTHSSPTRSITSCPRKKPHLLRT
jgi:hypothetical protein